MNLNQKVYEGSQKFLGDPGHILTMTIQPSYNFLSFWMQVDEVRCRTTGNPHLRDYLHFDPISWVGSIENRCMYNGWLQTNTYLEINRKSTCSLTTVLYSYPKSTLVIAIPCGPPLHGARSPIPSESDGYSRGLKYHSLLMMDVPGTEERWGTKRGM